MPSLLTKLSWRLWQHSCQKDIRRFEEALKQPRAAQTAHLRSILVSADGSEFAKKHQLSSNSSVAQFRQHVPIQTSEDLKLWTDRICKGEHNQLSVDPIERLVPTSGTTGRQKLIPMTAGSRAEYSTAVNLWLGNCMHSHPEIMNGRCYIATSPAQDTPQGHSKVPIGFAPDSAYLGRLEKLVLKQILAVPSKVAELRGSQWREQTRKHLLNCSELSFLSLWHPSYLDALFTADELHELGAKWRRLKLISTWSDGACSAPAKQLMRSFPQATHSPKGLWLTEGAVSVPWNAGTPIALLSGFFEFEDTDGNLWLADELKAEATYRPVITNKAGLYRYRLGDIVKVTGYVDQTPSLQWLGRADMVSDLCGEKLSDADASRAFESCGHSGFGILLPTQEGQSRFYTCLLEVARLKNFPKERFEKSLCENPHYKWARELGHKERAPWQHPRHLRANRPRQDSIDRQGNCLDKP
ncbi:MAG: GH3 family domain-containing protein [Coraliomargarita sp.]